MRMRTRVLLWISCVPLVLSAQNNLKTTLTQRYFNGVRRNLEAAADAMPDAKYGFKLTDGQMSFAEWINHSGLKRSPWRGFEPGAHIAIAFRDYLGVKGVDAFHHHAEPCSGIAITMVLAQMQD